MGPVHRNVAVVVGCLALWAPATSEAGPYPLLVSDTLGEKVWRIDGPHQLSVFADAADGLVFPAGLAVDSGGRVYVSSRDSAQIFRFSPDGQSVELFADASDGLDVPIGLCFGPDERLYVVNNGLRQILAFDQAGKGSVVVPSNEAELFSPLGIVSNDVGELFVSVFRGEGRSALVRCTLDGFCETVIGPGDGLSVPEFPAIDSLGTVYVPDFRPGAMFQFNPSGSFNRFLDDGELTSPTAVVPLGPDTFIVSDIGSTSVYQVNRAGQRIEIAGAADGLRAPANMISVPEPKAWVLCVIASLSVAALGVTHRIRFRHAEMVP